MIANCLFQFVLHNGRFDEITYSRSGSCALSYVRSICTIKSNLMLLPNIHHLDWVRCLTLLPNQILIISFLVLHSPTIWQMMSYVKAHLNSAHILPANGLCVLLEQQTYSGCSINFRIPKYMICLCNNVYLVWVNLHNSASDRDFCEATWLHVKRAK